MEIGQAKVEQNITFQMYWIFLFSLFVVFYQAHINLAVKTRYIFKT